MNRKEIEANCEAIKLVLERHLTNEEDMKEVKAKLMDLQVLLSLSAETMRGAKELLAETQRAYMKPLKLSEYSPNTLKLMIETAIGEESALYLYCDRLNAAITHSLDALRTVISLYKTEVSNSHFA